MALGAQTVRRMFPVAGAGDREVSGGAAPVFLAANKDRPVFLAANNDRPVDPMIWSDEKRMKRELVAWAKAVASMAASKKTSSSSSSMRRRE
ncbi:hypothetical protein EJB05_45640, partial [Eragrostis curvula]